MDLWSNGDSAGVRRIVLVMALLAIVVGGSVDLALDQPATWLSFHSIFELLMIAGALVLTTAFWLGWWRASRAAAELRRTLDERGAERDEWRASAQRALAGLGQAIDAQFRSWGLTRTERKVAFMILQGYGHKEVAARTGRSERTIRQHAGAVYEKAGLAGRAELAAYFLRDLMQPPESQELVEADSRE